MTKLRKLIPMDLLTAVYGDSLQNINMALALMTAFAWNEAVRKFLAKNFCGEIPPQPPPHPPLNPQPHPEFLDPTPSDI